MLGKLIKYDIRSNWRDFIAVYVSILLGVLILPQLFKNIGNEIVAVIGGFIAIGIAIATIVVMLVMLFKIFNTNVYSKEGYLTATLPVSSAKIVISKLIVSSMWIVLTGIVGTIGIFIFVGSLRTVSFAEISDVIRLFINMLGGNGLLAVILLVLSVIASIVKEIAKLFLSCSIAHLKQLNRLRIPVGILSYFVFSWLEVLFVQALMYIASLFPSMDEFLRKMEHMNQINDINSVMQFIEFLNGAMTAGIIYSLILTVAFSFGTIWFLNRKLDLD